MTQPADQPAPISRGEPLREAVYARVVELISAGRYPPGAALTEAALSRALRVSRTPVREALLRLQAEGVVQSSLARGFTVRPLDRREVTELYPILASLEGLAAQTAAPVPRSTLADLRRTAKELASCNDPVRRWQLDSRWHTAIVTASGNRQLLAIVTQLRTSLSRYELTYMRETLDRADADAQHRAIETALADRDSNRAAELVREHWYDGQRQVLAWMDRQSD
jgi:DNA-binding GntR family transcriptional regulator